MKFIFKPTLEHIARMKLVSALWNQHDIRALVEEFSSTTVFLQVDDNLSFSTLFGQQKWIGEKEEKWQKIETRVIEKIPQHIMQTSLKDKTIGYIKPIGLQVLRWMEYHRKCFCLNLKLPSEFCWTPQGTIDKKRTAEVLIKNADIDIITRYKLACIYCLKHDIPELWNKIPENLKNVFASMTDYISDPRELSANALLLFWSDFKKGNVHWKNKITIRRVVGSATSYLQALRSAAIMANKEATEYFLPKVRQSRVFLVKVAILVIRRHSEIDFSICDPPREYNAEVLSFLLSQMNDVQLSRVFQRYPCNVFFPLLEWPWQTFIVEIVSHLYRIVPEEVQILFAIATAVVRKVKLGYKDYNYRKMYGEIWQQLPNDCKSCNINGGSLTGIVALLLEIKDSENIKLMFQHISNTERNEFFSINIEIYMCSTMAEYKEWDLLKFFVQQCASSKDEMIKYKEKVMEHISRGSLKDEWDNFSLSQFFDDLVREFDKRKSVDEGECSTTKRLCKSDSTCEENS